MPPGCWRASRCLLQAICPQPASSTLTHAVCIPQERAKDSDMNGHHEPQARRLLRRLLALGLCALAGSALAGTTQAARTWLVSGAELITLLQAKALMGSATASSAGTCPALAPAPISRALPMPATASGVAKAGFFRMSWSTVCLPISGSCPASDCSRMRLHWLPKRCGPHFPVVVARHGVAVPSPAKTNRTGRARRVTTRTSYTLATRCIHGHRHPRCPHCMFLPQHEVPHGHL